MADWAPPTRETAPAHQPNDQSPAFSSAYDVHEQLGQGAFSTVRRCVQKTTGAVFAVKLIDTRPLRLREAFDVNRLLRETDIMRRIDHPNIIKLHEVFEEGDNLMLVMEIGKTGARPTRWYSTSS